MSEHPAFSAHVPKESIAAVVRTVDLLIVGQLHARPQKRLKDEMNHTSDRFMAITGAKVYDAAGVRLLYETAFLLVANAHVVTITPLDAVTQLGEAGWAAHGDGAPLAMRPGDSVS